ncbi:hypothetical protein RJ640_001293, partial [Escallonia rubra]
VLCQPTDRNSQLSQNDMEVSLDKNFTSRGPFVYGFIDLFVGSGESWRWGLAMEERGGIDPTKQPNTIDRSRNVHEILEKKIDQNVKLLVTQDMKQSSVPKPTAKLQIVEEKSEDENRNADSSRSLSAESAGSISVSEDSFLEEDLGETDDYDLGSEHPESMSSASVISDHMSQTMEKDLVLAHLLRIACTPKGPLADALPEITSELYNLGIFSERVRDLATKPSSLFDRTFDHVFREHMVSTKISQFWKTASDFGGQNSSSSQSSRYLNDFEELQPLGKRRCVPS